MDRPPEFAEPVALGGGSSEAALGETVLMRIDRQLQADAARRLNRAILRMDRFLLRVERQHLNAADPTKLLGQALIDEGRRLLRGALSEPNAHMDESTLRSAYRLTGAIANLAAWSAPASQESCAVNSFPLPAARDAVTYARYGGAETAAQEMVYTELLGFDPGRARLLLTSSGMAAYALIENFLLRDVLKPGDCVVMHPGVYFETQLQLCSLPFLNVRAAAGQGRADIIAAIAAYQPRVVYVDPLTNSADLRVLDLSKLLAEADPVCQHETWFVIDATLLSGAFDPFLGPPRRKARVLYYESACKYLQFGLDLGPAGIVVLEAALAERFERLRRGVGAVAPESLVLPRAARSVYLDYLRAQTVCAQTLAHAFTAFAQTAGSSCLNVISPTQSNHPDYLEASCYPHLGGLLAFRFTSENLNRRAPLEAFIDTLLQLAREQCVPLTAGVSFGFRVPRIGAAWSSYHADDAFLRVSAGVRPEGAAELGRLIGKCAALHAESGYRP